VGSAKKFVITGDPIFLDQTISGQKEFEKHLAQVSSIAGLNERKDLLDGVVSSYGEYTSLVNEEIELVRTKEPYSKSEYGGRTDKAVEQVLERLKTLENSYLLDIRTG